MASVYFLRQKNISYVKIGFTKYKNPKRRINSYTTYFPNGLDLIGYVILDNEKEGKDFEKFTHNYFKIFRIKNEWFNINENQIKDFLNKFNKKLESEFNVSYNYKKRQNKIIELNKTLSVEEISKLEKISIQYVYKILRNKKIKPLKTEKKTNYSELLKYMSVKEIAIKEGCSVQNIYKKLK